MRTLLDARGVVAGSSDGPVVPDLNPLLGIRAAITRSSASGRVIAPHESVSLEEGLRLYTHDAAFAAREDDLKGTIAPGKLADLVVLGGDLARVPADDLDAVKVELVLLDGEVAFAA